MPEGPDKHPPRVAQGRHEQLHAHRGTADRHRDRPKVDLQLLAGRRLKTHAGPRLGPQRLAQRRDRTLHCAQRHRDRVLTHKVLAHHIAVAAVLPEALPQPFIEPIETSPAARLANRHPATHRKIALDRIPAAPQLAGKPLRPPAQPVQLHHRRHLVRRQHPLPPRIQPRGELCPRNISVIPPPSGGSVSDVVRGQFFMSPDI
jgi:hypothetical protein